MTLSRTVLTAALGVGTAFAAAVPASAGTVPGDAGGTVRAAGPYCDPGWSVHVQRKVKYKQSTGERDELINRTSRTVQRTYSLTRQSQTKWNVTVEGSVSFKAWVFSEVNIKVGGGLEKQSSITKSVSDTVPVKAHRTLVVTRGFRKLKVYGYTSYTWSNCATGRYKSFVVTAPYSKYVEYKEVRN
ncbi:hypothetical protein DZF91_30840 [Actinomadura logoneensis]|uniref:Uncharacterized protein n=1 Tax=Actinomadura logoneensis TaxID=2293572 RepID=A0A372JCU9_9ACTN|nr:hypothetical protein DZF91_30840 [Actinomadura logoneensis]